MVWDSWTAGERRMTMWMGHYRGDDGGVGRLRAGGGILEKEK